jgi:hypothetical protein
VGVGVSAAFTAVVVFGETVNERGTVAGKVRLKVIKEINMIPERTTMIFSLVDMRSPLVQLRMRA